MKSRMHETNKAAEVELAQLKSALRFLADEWEEEATKGLLASKRSSAASQAGLEIGKSKARYEAAGAIHLTLNMIATLDDEHSLGPLSVVRQVFRTLIGRQ